MVDVSFTYNINTEGVLAIALVFVFGVIASVFTFVLWYVRKSGNKFLIAKYLITSAFFWIITGLCLIIVFTRG